MQSCAMFYMLKQTKQTFESNLVGIQKDEMANQTSYDNLKTPRARKLLHAIARLAYADGKLAISNEDLEVANKSLAAN